MDVFSREPGISGDTGRILKVGKVAQTVRFRSLLLWVGVHWCEGPGLCGGTGCAMCDAGIPRRRKAWVACDRPNGTLAALEITESDVRTLAKAADAEGAQIRPGMSFLIRRTADRQPLTVDSYRFFANVGEISQDVLQNDVLRFHGVMATMADIRTGSYRSLVLARAAELSRKTRAYA